MSTRRIARALAWFGIGLGIAEVLAPRELARAAGLDGSAGIVRLFGWREIASGVVVLAAREPEAWLWARVIGDALDGALLSSGIASPDPRRRTRALAATAVVAPVVALDAFYAFRRGR